MEKVIRQKRRMASYGVIFFMGIVAFLIGFIWAANSAHAKPKKRVVYRKNTKLDFEGLEIEGLMKNPAEFYFQHRPQERFDTLVKRRKNFHREMLRDSVLSK